MTSTDGHTRPPAALSMADDGPLPPPLPPPRPVHQATPVARRGYLAMHWHGLHSLPRSYWINTVLVGIGFRLLLAPLQTIHWARHGARWALIVLATSMLLSLTMALWQYVGLWRSAERHGGGWGGTVRVLIVLGCIGFCLLASRQVRVLRQLAQVVPEEMSWSDYRVSVATDGRAVVATGTMGIGFTDDVVQAFAAHPQLTLLRLSSRGGSVSEGSALYDFLAAHPGITVEADGLCASACTWAFIGGARRWTTPHTRFGFHQAHALIDSRVARDHVAGIEQGFRDRLAALGANGDFLQLAFAKQGTEVYVPDVKVLFDNHIISAVAAEGRRWDAAAWGRERYLYDTRLDPHSRAMAEAADRVAVVYPDLYQQWLAANQALPDARIGQHRTVLWTMLNHAADRRLATAPAADVRRYAAALRKALDVLRTKHSPADCGRYGAGQAVRLGADAEAFKAAIGPGYLALLARAGDAPLAVPVGFPRNRRGAASRAAAIKDDAGWAHQCATYTAALDRQLARHGATADRSLRAFLGGG